LAACSGDEDDDAESADLPGDPVELEGSIDLTLAEPLGCEQLDPAACILPFPSDFYMLNDGTSDTGMKVALLDSAMPVNVDGVAMDPTEWNRSDGYSPGSLMMTVVPDLDADASRLPPITDIAQSLAEDSPIALIDTDSGERVPVWAELDANAEDPARRALIITPARALTEGHRHVVALRNLVSTGGEPIAAGDVFRAYRDRLESDVPTVEERREQFEFVFRDLDKAGIARDDDLFLAWDFTVASTRSLSERLLHMRDEAMGTLGEDGAPPFTVTEVVDEGAARIVRGTYEVPRFLTGDGGPGSMMNYNQRGDLPEANGVQTASFVCTVPTGATAANPARIALYGHGLLGSAEEAVGLGQVAAAVNVGFCATHWIGMSTEDIPFAAEVLGDLGQFPAWADRLQQGHLNFLFLGRLVRSPAGFVTDPAFQDGTGAGALDRSDLFFLGASQGGILGGATSAVAQDWTRVVLAVPGMNYSVLLRRSIDFDEFAPILEEAYPDELDQQIGIALVQMLWDRGENQGYAQHLTENPYDNTPAKSVLLLEAFADHQVANIATENLARSIGAAVRQPALADGRSNDVAPMWGLEAVPSYPYPDSALVMWDFGTPSPPIENLPPREGEDPHGKAAEVVDVLLMVSDYLKTDGALTDVCNADPCQTLE
jgi:hypothetical protein